MTPRLIQTPSVVEAAGTPPKRIEEMIGRVNTGSRELSIAVMTSPAGWQEPGQTPEFDEYTLVLSGMVVVSHRGGDLTVAAGQCVVAPNNEWVRYSTPEGAHYVSVCVPAFAPETVHRDDEL
jgi:mannose-6-phosphate isomerase-like protein (cupin superfamily)